MKKIIGIVMFRKKGLRELSRNFSFARTVIAIIMSSAILSIPTTSQPAVQTAIQFAVTLAMLAVTMVVSALAAKILGAENKVENIVNASSVAVFLSLLVVSLPAGLITLWLIPLVLHTYLFGSLLFSVIPFYNFLVFGWAVKESSRGKSQKRKTITALVSLTLIMLFYIAISIV